MGAGNVWLPEDMHMIIVEFSGNSFGQQFSSMGPPGLWGSALCETLRDWMREHRRPLIWSDNIDGPMLIDPLVTNYNSEEEYSQWKSLPKCLFWNPK